METGLWVVVGGGEETSQEAVANYQVSGDGSLD